MALRKERLFKRNLRPPTRKARSLNLHILIASLYANTSKVTTVKEERFMRKFLTDLILLSMLVL